MLRVRSIRECVRAHLVTSAAQTGALHTRRTTRYLCERLIAQERAKQHTEWKCWVLFIIFFFLLPLFDQVAAFSVSSQRVIQTAGAGQSTAGATH